MKICTQCKVPKELKEFYKRKNRKNGYMSECKKCYKKRNKTYHKEHHKKFPWKLTLCEIKQRCNNKNNHKYLRYGGRGIKCLITTEELKQLWFRDKAYLMKIPSIDREDSNGNYEYSNCRYMELAINSGKDKKKSVLQFDLHNVFIKEYASIKKAGELNLIHSENISQCCRGKLKTSGGFKWRYK